MFHQILVAIDGSEVSDRVIEVACEMAKATRAPLTLVHAPQSETTALAVGAIAGLHAAMAMPTQSQIEAAGQQVLERGVSLAKRAGCTEASAILRQGEAADTVVEVAEEIGADLIVSGRRGLGGLGTLVLGSTSQRIAHLAECSCMTVV